MLIYICPAMGIQHGLHEQMLHYCLSPFCRAPLFGNSCFYYGSFEYCVFGRGVI